MGTRTQRVRSVTLTLLACLATSAVLATAPTALAGSAGSRRDVAATRAYIKADYTLVKTAKANIKASEAALRKLRRQIAGECPGAASESPQDGDSEQLGDELVGAMTIAAIGPDIRAVARFARVVKGLRWSDGTLTRKVAAYGARLSTLAKLPAPNMCADVRTWAMSRYQALAPSTVSFDASYAKVEVAVGEVPAKLLAPSEQPDERPALARARRLEEKLTEAETNAVYTWGHIMDSLGLNQ